MNEFEAQLITALAAIVHQLEEIDNSLVGIIQRIEDMTGVHYPEEEK